MLQAMNTGHDGSLTTVHANSSRDALMRLETLVALSGFTIAPGFIRRYISSALEIIIQLTRLVDGSRKIVSFQEITGMEGEVVTLQEIFSFEQTGVNRDGQVTTSDYTAWYNSARLGETGYLDTDMNMDGQVTTADYTLWYNNARIGAASQVP